ncbi:hypothetical protein VPH35_016052 [Triticum aestivum]
MGTKALILITVVIAMLGMALGASHTVGAPDGSWDLRTNYSQWVSRIRFTIGDELKFQYSTAVHNVVEVSKTGYDSCNDSSPIASFPTGNDVVPLATVGTRYFICGVSRHCDAGMKVEVNVKSKVVRTMQRCRRTGNRRRCQSETVLSSSAAADVDQSAVARLACVPKELVKVLKTVSSPKRIMRKIGSTGGDSHVSQWASRIRFTAGDELKFQYSAAVHNVVEVSKTEHDSCNGSSPVATSPTGNDVVPLAAVGIRYFICGIPGCCNAGMKVEVNVKRKEVRMCSGADGEGTGVAASPRQY